MPAGCSCYKKLGDFVAAKNIWHSNSGLVCPQETMPGPFYSRKNRATPATVMTVPMISLRETRCLLMME